MTEHHSEEGDGFGGTMGALETAAEFGAARTSTAADPRARSPEQLEALDLLVSETLAVGSQDTEELGPGKSAGLTPSATTQMCAWIAPRVVRVRVHLQRMQASLTFVSKPGARGHHTNSGRARSRAVPVSAVHRCCAAFVFCTNVVEGGNGFPCP